MNKCLPHYGHFRKPEIDSNTKQFEKEKTVAEPTN